VKVSGGTTQRQNLRFSLAVIRDRFGVDEELAHFKNLPVAAPAAAVPPMVMRAGINETDGPLLDQFANKDIAFADEREDKKELGGVLGGVLRAQNMAKVAPLNVLTVREFAHLRRPGWTEDSRADFAETVYWNAGVKTNDFGSASVSFDLSDSVTSFQI